MTCNVFIRTKTHHARAEEGGGGHEIFTILVDPSFVIITMSTIVKLSLEVLSDSLTRECEVKARAQGSPETRKGEGGNLALQLIIYFLYICPIANLKRKFSHVGYVCHMTNASSTQSVGESESR